MEIFDRVKVEHIRADCGVRAQDCVRTVAEYRDVLAIQQGRRRVVRVFERHVVDPAAVSPCREIQVLTG